MTAYFLKAYGDRMELLTDTANLDPATGCLMNCQQKFGHFETGSYVAVASGDTPFAAAAGVAVLTHAQIYGLKATRAAFERIVAAGAKQVQPHLLLLKPFNQLRLRVTFAGFHGIEPFIQTCQLEGGQVRSVDSDPSGVYSGPDITSEQAQALAEDAGWIDFDRPLKEIGVTFIDLIRQLPPEPPSKTCGVGGHLFWTCIQPAKPVVSELLHDWRDEIGKPIKPMKKPVLSASSFKITCLSG
ncbi:MAG: hypothetical protein CMJ42_13470 [Phyllobacteriaceae bacterium]|nr:hypothetical protein [Phyllobacteriaceae bacterium]MBA89599.1 hypothetical protein [Phyllobacteriaceae bacterium]|tara:strand:- start:145 stop:870 length:726 start_codon:yes stop_codon:yes gene_type:complete